MLKSILRHPACTLLAIYYTIVLMVPNMALCFTEPVSAMSRVINILMPLGVYLLILSAFKRTGWVVWAMLPLSVLAAFQLVLLFLYGGSIIAVDMFLNVVTTNMSEATELLANLGAAIVVVVILYLPPLIWATVTLVRKKTLKRPAAMAMRFIGGVLFAASAIMAVVANHVDSDYKVGREVFPVNVMHNIKIAVDRTVAAEHYGETSAAYKFGSKATHDTAMPEVYVMVIGETSRAINWQLGGYDRPTNKCLSCRDGLVFNTRALSESNTTHKSVPMLMSSVRACNFDSIGCVKSIITAFKEAGYKTAFISNQAPNHSYTQFFGEEADMCEYMPDSLGCHSYDQEMLDVVKRCLADTVSRKQFIVLHSYGSHFKYQERYPAGYGSFKPDECKEVNQESRQLLVNSYDNSIEYTDMWLDELMDMLERSGRTAAVVYSSDHGEDILDDSRGRFLHASPTPTYYQLHVAMLSWVSGKYRNLYPDKYEQLKAHSDVPVSSTASLFDTMLDLAGIDTEHSDLKLSLASESYTRPDVLYLNDMNKGVDYAHCGLKKRDIATMNEKSLL